MPEFAVKDLPLGRTLMMVMMMGLSFFEFGNYHFNFQNCMILILHNLDFENGKHTKFEFNWSISFRDTNFKIILICKYQNVPCSLGFEV